MFRVLSKFPLSLRRRDVALVCVAVFATVALGSGTLAVLAEEVAETASPPGEIKFVGKNMLMTANGTFKSWKFTKVVMSEDAPGVSLIEIEVDVASLDTGIVKRDNHLRTADFFDVEKYPVARLRISDIVTSGKDDEGRSTYTAKVDFDIHGVKKSYSGIVFRILQASPLKVEGEFKIDRMEFDIGEPKTINPMSIKEEIPISFSATIPGTD